MRRWRTPFTLVVVNGSLAHARVHRRRWPLRWLLPGLCVRLGDEGALTAVVKDWVEFPTAPTLRGVAVQQADGVRIVGSLRWTQLKLAQGSWALMAAVTAAIAIGSMFRSAAEALGFGACALGTLGLFAWTVLSEATSRQDDEEELIEKLTELFVPDPEPAAQVAHGHPPSDDG